jgi:hypothetical protein
MLEEAAKALDEARIVQPSASMNLQITNADTEQLSNHHSKN